MKYIYHVERTDEVNYDEYSNFVCCAESEDDAKNIHPGGYSDINSDDTGTWRESNLKVKLIGIADDSIELNSVICASFHAG